MTRGFTNPTFRGGATTSRGGAPMSRAGAIVASDFAKMASRGRGVSPEDVNKKRKLSPENTDKLVPGIGGYTLPKLSGLPLTPRKMIDCQDLKAELHELTESIKEKDRMVKQLALEVEEGKMREKAIWEEYRGFFDAAKIRRDERIKKADEELLRAAAELREKDKQTNETIVKEEENYLKARSPF